MMKPKLIILIIYSLLYHSKEYLYKYLFSIDQKPLIISQENNLYIISKIPVNRDNNFDSADCRYLVEEKRLKKRIHCFRLAMN
jgi:hypothetical protein